MPSFNIFPGYLGSGPGLWRTTPVSLIQAGDWKLMEFLEDGRIELYNLADDIGETRTSHKQTAKAKELYDRLVNLAKPSACTNATKHGHPTKTNAKAYEKGKGKEMGKRKAEAQKT